ncbi:hypothetical protein DIQ79_06345 [Mycolicibacterium smegmatis]|uniref:Uncharacterized protein n=1 Tax=Mycolicibacterium smegmatis (strain ATCC 700084 / mc(2)155) TaxID=246196 RepID=A0R132_MYCS2|nr:hypothetical protein MSMEG_4602 [Mycolicibacterium smegmatis MC2 155]TBM52416.1 hypothetical protein DIQ86_03425 [Mycolicibacterium smegmatis]TBH50714.1 hypothetical protein EYS45_04865 [Mycolicibacterium smegmatis MC2 155]TBM54272.1 hypothetical protein DIQ85_06325 [Mycolicibacterium smegmatis]TBM65798.1 hypothetical protein DIQ83_06345 [Mycolicibacterium smegmatis]
MVKTVRAAYDGVGRSCRDLLRGGAVAAPTPVISVQCRCRAGIAFRGNDIRD